MVYITFTYTRDKEIVREKQHTTLFNNDSNVLDLLI